MPKKPHCISTMTSEVVALHGPGMPLYAAFVIVAQKHGVWRHSNPEGYYFVSRKVLGRAKRRLKRAQAKKSLAAMPTEQLRLQKTLLK